MTYEQKIIYDTLCEVRDEIYEIADNLKGKVKNDKTFNDSIRKAQAETVEATALIVGEIAQKHGIKVGFEEME